MIRMLFTFVLLMPMAMAVGQSNPMPVEDAKPSPDELFRNWAGSDVRTSYGNSAYMFMGSFEGLENAEFTAEFNSSMPWRFRATISPVDRPSQAMMLGSNGEVTWRYLEKQTESGEKEDLQPTIVNTSSAIANQLLFNPLSLSDIARKISRSNTVGKIEFYGSPCWRVICLPVEDSSPINFYFELDSGLLKGIEFRKSARDPKVVGMIVKDFRVFGNQATGQFKFPARIELVENGETRTQVTIKSMTPVKKLVQDEFKIPAVIKAIMKPKSSVQDTDGQNENLISMIGPSLLNYSGAVVSSDVLKDKSNILLYFSAKWCGPCRSFTPRLVKFFNEHAADQDFTVVFVSSDRSVDQQIKYMQEYKMDFYAVPLARVNASGLKRMYGGRGIPDLVWLNSDGVAMAKSYVNGNYVGPNKVLADFSRSLGIN